MLDFPDPLDPVTARSSPSRSVKLNLFKIGFIGCDGYANSTASNRMVASYVGGSETVDGEPSLTGRSCSKRLNSLAPLPCAFRKPPVASDNSIVESARCPAYMQKPARLPAVMLPSRTWNDPTIKIPMSAPFPTRYDDPRNAPWYAATRREYPYAASITEE